MLLCNIAKKQCDYIKDKVIMLMKIHFSLFSCLLRLAAINLEKTLSAVKADSDYLSVALCMQQAASLMQGTKAWRNLKGL